MPRSDLVRLVVFMALGAAAGAVIGVLVTLLTGVGLATVFFAVGGSYLALITADNRWGPRSRKARLRQAEAERRKVAAEGAAQRQATIAARRGSGGRAARKAAARSKR